MEQHSNNKFDELFQKAADEYPLKTNNKNWDIVSARLHTASSTLNKKNSKWKYSSVLIVILLAGSFFVIKSIHQKTADTVKHSTLSKKTNKINSQKSSDISMTSPSELSVSKTSAHRIPAAENSALANNSHLYFHNEKATINTNDVDLNKEKTQILQQPLNEPLANTTNQNFDLKNLNQVNNNPVDITKNILQSNNESNNTTDKKNQKSTPVKFRAQPKTLYGMLFFSPDFSTVKFQHVNKPGYSIGVAIGYRINNRFSAEIGLQRLHANFYSDGKYVDTTNNLKLKSAVKALQDLNGNNKITEVPVDIKFNLLKNNDHLFVTAGTTVALLMHAEKYDYNLVRNGSLHDVHREFSAITGTKFFSSINFSLGYQAAINNMFNIKVEPYYQAATKGLGVGNLPISNFGVNIGIIKDIK